jgi:hypothetical protein
VAPWFEFFFQCSSQEIGRKIRKIKKAFSGQTVNGQPDSGQFVDLPVEPQGAFVKFFIFYSF